MRAVARAWVAALALWGCDGAVEEAADAQVDAQVDTGPVTWSEHVAPILAEHCVSCHRADSIAPYPLDRYDDAAAVAPLIEAVTADGTMPPWGARHGDGCNAWQDARVLDEDSRRLLAAWAATGAAPGDPAAEAPPPPEPPGLASVGATLDPGIAYVPDARLTDDYRCFVVDPGLDADRFLTAYAVHPGEPRTVHHVILFAIGSALGEEMAEGLDARDETPGYTCFGGANVADATLLGAWAPGTPVVRYPEETGIRLPAGRKLVMQVHYNTLAGALPDRTTIDLELAPAVPREAFIYTLADLAMHVPAGLEWGETVFEIDLAEVGLPVGAFARGVFPHMHQRGRSITLERRRVDERQCMVDVPRWDFEWQRFYFYREPVYVYPDDTLRLTCRYDTRGLDAPVVWGEGTADEMCLMGLYVTLF